MRLPLGGKEMEKLFFFKVLDYCNGITDIYISTDREKLEEEHKHFLLAGHILERNEGETIVLSCPGTLTIIK